MDLKQGIDKVVKDAKRNRLKNYQFPELNEKDLEMAKKYGLKMLGKLKESNEYSTKGDTLMQGTERDLKRYGKEYLGDYELHPDYLYDDGSFDLDLLEREQPKKRMYGFSWKVPSGYKQALYETDFDSVDDFLKEREDFRKQGIDVEEMFTDKPYGEW